MYNIYIKNLVLGTEDAVPGGFSSLASAQGALWTLANDYENRGLVSHKTDLDVTVEDPHLGQDIYELYIDKDQLSLLSCS